MSKETIVIGVLGLFVIAVVTYNMMNPKEIVFAKDTCRQPLVDGNAELSIQFSECAPIEGDGVMRVPMQYLESCSITDYMVFGDYIVNSSDESSVDIQAKLPDWQPVDASTKPEDIIDIELQTRRCIGGKESYTDSQAYIKNWVQEVSEMKNENGDLLYASPVNISEKIKFYKSLTATKYHGSNVYVLKRDNEEFLTFNCGENRCRTNGEPFRKNFTLIYRFDRNHIEELPEIDSKIHQMLNSFFVSNGNLADQSE